MIEDYPHYPDSTKPRVVDAIDCTPANQAQFDFFSMVILVEVNTSAVARASRHLLDAKKYPRATEADRKNYSRLADQLRCDNVPLKQRALSEIDQYAGAPVA